MATRAETRRIRIAQWRKILEEKASSGLTAKEFCTKNNISRDAYYYWQDIVRRDALSELKQPTLVELKPPAIVDEPKQIPDNHRNDTLVPQLTITINNATIKVDSDTPKELLSMVLEVVSRA